MTDEKLMELVKRVDPQAVRLPFGIKAIAAEIEAVEREACAKLVDSHPQTQLATQYDWTRRIGQDLADAIRARSNAE